MKKVGLIVNPIAGLGGRVGLKGTDGLVAQALALGALPQAPARAGRALTALNQSLGEAFELYAAPGEMGETLAREQGMVSLPLVVDRIEVDKRDETEEDGVLSPGHDPVLLQSPGGETTARDTRLAARALVAQGADLILFAGGDGTARDVCLAVGDRVPVIGIPAGVKIHSPVFARNPESAGELAAQFLSGEVKQLAEQEVLDIDEDAYRKGRVTTRLFGYLMVPESGSRIQSRKAGTPVSERATQNQISLSIMDDMMPDWIYLVGPGTTIRPVMRHLNLDHSLLGVDMVKNGELLVKDATEAQILEQVKGQNFKIVITPIGGQGYLFGRGNHQFSPHVIRLAGRENIIVGATLQKIGSFRGQPFGVDTGDPEVDELLRGYIRVVTGYRREMVHPIA